MATSVREPGAEEITAVPPCLAALPMMELRIPARSPSTERGSKPGPESRTKISNAPSVNSAYTLMGSMPWRAAFVAGQVQFVGMGASVAGNMMAKNPQLAAEYKLLLKESPCYIGVAKGEDALKAKVNEILAEAKKSGELDRLSKQRLREVLKRAMQGGVVEGGDRQSLVITPLGTELLQGAPPQKR